MRVLLVSPGLYFENAFPLGLAYLAAALRAGGHRVLGYDAGVQGLSELPGWVSSFSPGLIGIPVWQANLKKAAAIAHDLRLRTRAPIVIGGPFVSLEPAASLRATGADHALLGDAEESIVDLASALESREDPARVAGGAWLDARGALQVGPERAIVTDLDSLPLPDRHLFPPHLHQRSWVRKKGLSAPMITSRGCPCSCAHCCAPTLHGGRWRGRSPSQVVNEILVLVAEHGVRHVLIEDEQPLVDRGRFLEICERMTLARLDLRWSLPNGLRPEALDRELLHAMSRAGCSGIALGVESGDRAVLERIGRHPNVEQAREIAAQASAQGMEVTAYLMLGLPGESGKACFEAARIAAEIGATQAHFSLYEPVKGSRLDAPAALGLSWGLRRAADYLHFYLHPGRAHRVFERSKGEIRDLPRAALRLGDWLAHGFLAQGAERPG